MNIFVKRHADGNLRLLKLGISLFIVFVVLNLIPYRSFASPAGESKKESVNAPDSDYARYESENKLFRSLVPKSWSKEEDKHPYGDLTKVYGVKLIGPVNKDGAPVTISLLHYSGERIFTKYQDYIHNRLNSIVRTDYDHEATITDTTVGGLPGKKSEIKTFMLISLPTRGLPPMKEGIRYEIAPPSIKVEMIDQFIVIPSGKGFYVLGYRAPEDIADQYQDVFEKVTDSFHPHPE